MKALLLTGFVVLAATGAAMAAESDAAQTKETGKTAAPASGAPKKKTTDVSFDDVLVQGKYHFADEAVTTVEQDKVLDALLGVRTDFKDRTKKSAARH